MSSLNFPLFPFLHTAEVDEAPGKCWIGAPLEKVLTLKVRPPFRQVLKRLSGQRTAFPFRIVGRAATISPAALQVAQSDSGATLLKSSIQVRKKRRDESLHPSLYLRYSLWCYQKSVNLHCRSCLYGHFPYRDLFVIHTVHHLLDLDLPRLDADFHFRLDGGFNRTGCHRVADIAAIGEHT